MPMLVWWLILYVSLTGLKDALITGKTVFLSFWECLRKRLAFELVDWVRQITLTLSVGIIQSIVGLIEQKDRGRANSFFLLELSHPSSPALWHWCSWFLAFRLRPGLIPSTILTPPPPYHSTKFSGLQTQTELIPPASTPGSPACKWQNLGLSLNNCVNQFLY